MICITEQHNVHNRGHKINNPKSKLEITRPSSINSFLKSVLTNVTETKGNWSIKLTCLNTVCNHHGWPAQLHSAVSQMHGWEIAVILRNFRKTKLSKSKFFFFFFFFLTLFQHVYNVQLDDFRFATYANIAFRHFTALPTAKPPSSFAHTWYKHGVPSASWTPARYFFVFQ